MHRLLIVPVLTLIVAAAVGCGSSDNGSTATSSSDQAAADTPAGAIGTTKGALGEYLVDDQGRTLYLWEKDTGSTSVCSGACAQAWPPTVTTSAPTAAGAVSASKLGTSKRSDGTTQVTYAGHPLYTFVGDKSAGQTNGQGSDGFGAEWYVVAPSGKAIEDDSGGGQTKTTSASGGRGY